jgi:hypothetical protein
MVFTICEMRNRIVIKSMTALLSSGAEAIAFFSRNFFQGMSEGSQKARKWGLKRVKQRNRTGYCSV